MKPNVKIDGEILEFQSRPYTSKTDEERTYTSALICFGGKVMKFAVEKGPNLQPMVGEEAEIKLAFITYGESLNPSLRVVGAK